MTQPRQQSFKNHVSIDPSFHFVGTAVLLFNLCVGIIFVVMSLHHQLQLLLAIWGVVVSVTLILVFFKSRQYPLKVQDRIIRLEERLRMEALLPHELKPRIPELTEDQLIGLRFASDEELPELVEKTLEHHLDRKQIKERIQNWRPDHFRI